MLLRHLYQHGGVEERLTVVRVELECGVEMLQGCTVPTLLHQHHPQVVVQVGVGGVVLQRPLVNLLRLPRPVKLQQNVTPVDIGLSQSLITTVPISVVAWHLGVV